MAVFQYEFGFQMLAHVLSYLPPSDRLEGAFVCGRWAKAMCTSTLLDDVRLRIDGKAGMEAAEAVLMRSLREHRNLKLSRGEIT